MPIVKIIVKRTATYSVAMNVSEFLRPQHRVHQIHEGGEGKDRREDCHARYLDVVAQPDEAEHRGEHRERQNDHSGSRHRDSYERLHAAMTIRMPAATISHPASHQGHTGALMWRLSRSM